MPFQHPFHNVRALAPWCLACILAVALASVVGCGGPAGTSGTARTESVSAQNPAGDKKPGSNEGYMAICQMYIVIQTLNENMQDAVTHRGTDEGEVAFYASFTPTFETSFLQNGQSQNVVASPMFAAAASDSAYEHDYELLLSAAKILHARSQAFEKALKTKGKYVDPNPGAVKRLLKEAYPARPASMPSYPPAKSPFEMGKYLEAGGINAGDDLQAKLKQLGFTNSDSNYVIPGSQVIISFHGKIDNDMKIIAGTSDITGPEFVKAVAAYFKVDLDGTMDKTGNVYSQAIKYKNHKGEIVYRDAGEDRDLVVMLSDSSLLL